MSNRERPLPTEGPTWPKPLEAETDAPLPHLRRPDVPERKVTLRDLPVPTPNRRDTVRYADQLPPSDPPPPPDDPDADAVTQLRLAEPVPFYIDRDSVAPDEAPTQTFAPLDDETTHIKTDDRPAAMNFGKIAAPRYGTVEPVRIQSSKPSAMRLNVVEPAVRDVNTDAPVSTPSQPPRTSLASLSGQRLHRALPIFTGVAFLAIGAATTVILMQNGGRTKEEPAQPAVGATPPVAIRMSAAPVRVEESLAKPATDPPSSAKPKSSASTNGTVPKPALSGPLRRPATRTNPQSPRATAKPVRSLEDMPDTPPY